MPSRSLATRPSSTTGERGGRRQHLAQRALTTRAVKSLNYLDNVLARREAEARGADDALLLNTAGGLACASAANLFLLLDGLLVTPSAASGVLPGTLRGLVAAELAPRAGLEVVERAVWPEELGAAKDLFLTNALLGIVLLTEVYGLPIRTEGPGSISAELLAI